MISNRKYNIDQVSINSEITTPSDGNSIIYPKRDNNWYIMGSDSIEFRIGKDITFGDGFTQTLSGFEPFGSKIDINIGYGLKIDNDNNISIDTEEFVIPQPTTTIILDTYQELYDLIISAELIPGAFYKFPYRSTNFVHGQGVVDNGIRNGFLGQSVEFENNFDDVHIGEEEILIAQAISTFQLSPIAHSEKYPQDIIEFMSYVDKLGIYFKILNGFVLSNQSEISGFDLQWDLEKEQVYFQMPNGYPINYGHFLYVYAEFEKITHIQTGGEVTTLEAISPDTSSQLSSFLSAASSNGMLGLSDSAIVPIHIYNDFEEVDSWSTNGNGKDARIFAQYMGTSKASFVTSNTFTQYPGNNFVAGDEIYITYKGTTYTFVLGTDFESSVNQFSYRIPETTTSGQGNGLLINILIFPGKDGFIINDYINGGTSYVASDISTFILDLLGVDYNFNLEVFNATPIESGTIVEDYYQDGCFEPIMPGITICQYPYTSDDPDFGYGKAMSRAEVSQDRTRVYLIDLTQEDVENYISDTLYVEHVEGIVDCQGWITKREDTQKKVSMPLDWRNFKYRRWLYDLELVKLGMGADYYGITSFDNISGLESASTQWKDFPVSAEGQDLCDVQVGGIGGPNEYQWYLGQTSNFVFNEGIYGLKIKGNLSNSTFLSSLINITFTNNVQKLFKGNGKINSISFMNLSNSNFKLLPGSGQEYEIIYRTDKFYIRDINTTTGEQEITEI